MTTVIQFENRVEVLLKPRAGQSPYVAVYVSGVVSQVGEWEPLYGFEVYSEGLLPLTDAQRLALAKECMRLYQAEGL